MTVAKHSIAHWCPEASRRLLVATVVATAACAPSEPPEAERTASSPALECATAGFPCSWAEVDPAVDSLSRRLAQGIAADLGRGAEPLAAARQLAAMSEMAEVLVGDHAIRFRVQGGRPEWISTGVLSGTLGAPPVALPPSAAPAALPSPASSVDPVGNAGRNQKSALFLSPFDWQWSIENTTDLVDQMAAEFKHSRDYGPGNVNVRKNELNPQKTGIDYGVDLDSFRDWHAYDVIHVTTHGGSTCQRLSQGHPADLAAGVPAGTLTSAACKTGLSTSLPWTGPLPVVDNDRSFHTAPGIDRHWIPGLSPTLIQTRAVAGLDTAVDLGLWIGPFLGVSLDFFRAEYPTGLDETVVFLNACSSGAQSDLVTHLSGSTSTVIGWEQTMALDVASPIAACVWDAFLGSGPDSFTCARVISTVLQQGQGGTYAGGASAEGINDLIDELLRRDSIAGGAAVASGGVVLSTGSAGDTAVVGPLRPGDLMSHGDNRNRAVEIVRLMTPGTEAEVADSSFVQIRGTPGDGVADTLELEIEVFGLDAKDQPDQMELSVDIDGIRQSASMQLARIHTVDRHRTVPLLPLDADLTPDDSIDVGIHLAYPDGTSAWVYRQLWYGCATDHNGDMSGTFQGAIPRTVAAGGRGGRSWLRPMGGGQWSFGVENRFESDVSLQMVLNGDPVAGDTIMVSDPDLMRTMVVGGGIGMGEPDGGSFQTGVLQVTFDAVGEGVACGRVTGVADAYPPSRTRPQAVPLDVDVRFWAEVRR